MDAQTQHDDDGGFPPKHMRAPYADRALLPPPAPLPLVANLSSERARPRALQGASLAWAIIGGVGLVGLVVWHFAVKMWHSRQSGGS